ncbi:MAG: endonuclease/exonuclease/phosphatase family protein [Verrucomicrobiota bacterium JB023]|nr:endonuclease/exonuclease/phosphatase family protein [Verrucomicrobiota bacterium JB023]
MKSLIALFFVFAYLSVHSVNADKIATYNLRYQNERDAQAGNGWEQRKDVISEQILFHAFDVVGTQEGLSKQMSDLASALEEFELVSFGRDDGREKGEHVGIFYRTSRYQLEDSGFFWLSETPDQLSKGWDAALPRICTWAKLQRRAGGSFFIFNIHFDHRGQQAREESAKLLLEKIDAIAGEGPVVLLGDFNATEESQAYFTLQRSERLRDSFELAPVKLARVGTFNGFDPDSDSASRIDHLFVSEHFTVHRYGILTDTYRSMDELGGESRARVPSDHFPVVIEVTLNH